MSERWEKDAAERLLHAIEIQGRPLNRFAAWLLSWWRVEDEDAWREGQRRGHRTRYAVSYVGHLTDEWMLKRAWRKAGLS